MEFFQFESPIGWMGLGAEDGAIIRVYLPNSPTPRLMPRSTPLLEEGRKQILEYLAGERKQFDLPLEPTGTPFQKKVWKALQGIPWGETCSYRDIAQAVDCPGGFRAVGMANRNNPLPILIPCHRVIGADGSLGGYAAGTDIKKALLAVEQVEVK